MSNSQLPTNWPKNMSLSVFWCAGPSAPRAEGPEALATWDKARKARPMSNPRFVANMISSLGNEGRIVMDRVLVKAGDEGASGIMDDGTSVIAEGAHHLHGLPQGEGEKLDLLLTISPRQVGAAIPDDAVNAGKNRPF